MDIFKVDFFEPSKPGTKEFRKQKNPGMTPPITMIALNAPTNKPVLPAPAPARTGVTTTVAPAVAESLRPRQKIKRQFKKKPVMAMIAAAAVAIGVVIYFILKPSAPGNGIVSGNGRIEATEIDVAAKLAGRVQNIMVNEGDLVQVGEPLAQMQTDVLDAQRAEAQAQSQQAITAVASAEAQVAARQSDTAAAQATVGQRAGELDAARRRFARTQRLATDGVVTMQEGDDDRASWHGTEAAVTAAQAEVTAAQAGVKAAQAQVADAKAGVTASMAAIATIAADIADSLLQSTCEGRVQYRVAQPGEVLGAGGTVLNLVDLNDVYLTIFLADAAAGRLAIGTEVHLVLNITRGVFNKALGFANLHTSFWPLPAAPPAVDLDLRARYNPNLEQSWFGGLSEIINNVTMLAIILTGAAIIREREHGTIEHLLVMPVTPAEIMPAKVWAMGLVVLLAAGIGLLVVVRGVLRVPIAGSVPLFLAGTALHLFAATALGIFLATVARSMPQFGMLTVLILLPLQMLSGTFSPRESMPELVQFVMLAAPTTHFVALGQAILFRGAGFAVVWPQFLALIAIGALCFGFSLTRFRKTISEMTQANPNQTTWHE